MNRILYLLAMLFLMVAAGCQSSGAPALSKSCPGFDDFSDAAARGKIRFIGNPEVSINQIRCVATEGLLRVDVDMINQKSSEQRIEYRFQWFEADGMSVDPDEAWKPVLLYPRETRTIRTASPSKNSREFVLVIKR